MTPPGNFQQRPATIQAMVWNGSNEDDFAAWLGAECTIEGPNLRVPVPAFPGATMIVTLNWFLLRDSAGNLNTMSADAFMAQFQAVS